MRSQADYTVALYSDNPATRTAMRRAIGRRPSPDVGQVDCVDFSNYRDLVAAVDANTLDVIVLDGEAQPTGGLGIVRQLRDQIAHPPRMIVSVARRQDRWLATWAGVDATLAMPLDPVEVAKVLAEQLRGTVTRAAS